MKRKTDKDACHMRSTYRPWFRKQSRTILIIIIWRGHQKSNNIDSKNNSNGNGYISFDVGGKIAERKRETWLEEKYQE